jgi:hypothetical protein
VQVRFDPRLSPPSVDRGIGRRLAGDLDDVGHSLPDGAVDDRDLLGRHGRTHQDDGLDAVQGRIQRGRAVETPVTISISSANSSPQNLTTTVLSPQDIQLSWNPSAHDNSGVAADRCAVA